MRPGSCESPRSSPSSLTGATPHVLLENFLEPYLFNGQKTESGMKVVASTST